MPCGLYRFAGGAVFVRERLLDVAVDLIEDGVLALQILREGRRVGDVGGGAFGRRDEAVPRLELGMAPSGIQAPPTTSVTTIVTATRARRTSQTLSRHAMGRGGGAEPDGIVM